MKKTFTLWIAMLFSCMAFAPVSTWDGSWEPWTNGTGTENDPVLIENAQQLAYLAYRVNNGLDAGGTHISNHDYHYKLMVDVDLNGSQSFQWTPIGYWNADTDYQCFGGYFDGNGHTISGLYISNSNDRIGFFGYTYMGEIINLFLTGNKVSTTGQYAGGICGQSISTLIENCSFVHTGEVSSIVSTQYSYAGGIAGYATGIIKNCSHNGLVKSISNYSYGTKYSYAGGIAGFATGIVNSCNFGNVFSTEFSGGMAGGMISSYTSLFITNCFNTGEISGNGSSGGIVGYCNNTLNITNCYNKGSISSSSGVGNCRSGGIVGQGSIVYILDCYNVGTISANNNNYIGGIVGYRSSGGNVSNCYYLNTCGGNNSFGGQPMSAEAMQSTDFINMLNNGFCAWEQDLQPYTNSGYPLLTMMLLTVNTMEATNVTQSHATLHGTIEAENASVQSQGFEYKETTNPTWQALNVTTSGTISHTLSNLIPNTQYIYRTFCTDDCGTTYGEVKTFSTLSIAITTNNATDITQTHATLNGNFNIGDASITSQGFEYKKSTDDDYQFVNVLGSDDISQTISDLIPNTQYQFRVFCSASGYETLYGTVKTFSTLSIATTTNNATDITQTHATLNGNFNIGDANITSQGFEYKKNTDDDYQIVNVSGNGDVSQIISDLIPNTQYQFRVFCSASGCETLYGTVKTFSTLPVYTNTYNAADVTQTHATLNGNINAGDADVTTQGFEYKQSSASSYQTVNVSGDGAISHVLSGLVPNTSYTYRAFCTVANCGTTYGEQKTFTTLPVIVTTHNAYDVTASSAILHGSIDIGDATLVSKGFEYRIVGDQNYTTINVTGNENDFYTQLLELQVNTTYEYRAFLNITENTNTYYGDTKTFEVTWLNSDTICIYNADMLRWVSEQCNGGNTFQGKYIKLMNDITLPLNVPNNMTSIGIYPDYPFKGTFDGNGMHINNLYIDHPNTEFQGFFGYTLNANLYNVGLVNITASGRNYTGGMVAYAENTYMRDCYVNGGTLFALSYCGGLVGYQQEGTNSIISGCYNTCEVTGNNYVGGLIGFSNYSTVRNSYVAGPVTAQGAAVGAIIGGANEVLMYYCYFNIELTGQTNAIGENNTGGKDGGEGLTSSQMRDPQFVATLNQGLTIPVWMPDYASPINNGFPILQWQQTITSLKENTSESFSLYPNPTNGHVTIEASNLRYISIFNTLGQQVYNGPAYGDVFEYDFGGYEAGIYLIQIETAGGVETKRVVVAKLE